MKSFLMKEERIDEQDRKAFLILDILRKNGPISKAEVSRISGINVVTVSNYINNFLKKNFILEKELDVSSGGRRPLLLDINSNAALAVGIGLNLFNIVGSIVDLRGNILYEVKKDYKFIGANEVIKCLTEIIEDVIANAGEHKNRIKGIGIGLGGVVDKKTGDVNWPQLTGSQECEYNIVHISMCDFIEKKFGIPVFVDNDATLACFGEKQLTLPLESKNVLYMFAGVGCGIVIDGQIYRGSDGLAGEISIYNPKEELMKCPIGDPCFLKRWRLDMGMVEELKSILNKYKGRKTTSSYNPEEIKRILSLVDGDIDKLTLQHILDLSGQGFAIIDGLISRAAVLLGIKIAFLVNLLNPEVVIIGGGFEKINGPFMNVLKKTVSEWAFEESVRSLKIIPSHLGDRAVALGAASLVVRQVFINL